MTTVYQMSLNIGTKLANYINNEQLFPVMPENRCWLKIEFPFISFFQTENYAPLCSFIAEKLESLPFVPDYHPDLNGDIVNKLNWRIKELALDFRSLSQQETINVDDYEYLVFQLFDVLDAPISNDFYYCWCETDWWLN